MNLSTQFKIKNNPLLQKYIRESIKCKTNWHYNKCYACSYADYANYRKTANFIYVYREKEYCRMDRAKSFNSYNLHI